MKMTKLVSIILLLLITVQCHYKKNSNMKYKLNFHTQYNQFFLEDKEKKANTNSSDFWSDEAFNAKLAMVHGIVGVGTHSYGNIKGEIEILDKPVENIDYKLYDHVVEGGISVESGELQILDCPNSSVELELKVKPGKYRVRVYGSNFASVKEPDLTNDSDNDFYKIEIWPDDNMERKVLKQYIEK